MKHGSRATRLDSGITIVEVLVTALLIFISLGSILAMNTRSLHLLRSTRQAVASSQIVQQRVESIRNRPWPEVTNAKSLAALLRVPTDSEKELATANFVEFVTLSVPDALGGEAVDSPTLHLRRERGQIEVLEDDDLRSERMVLVKVTLQWRDQGRVQQRIMRTVVCRNGLTRGGIFGSNLGRPAPPTPGLVSQNP